MVEVVDGALVLLESVRHMEVLKGIRHVLKVPVLEVMLCVLLCMRDEMIVTLSTAC